MRYAENPPQIFIGSGGGGGIRTHGTLARTTVFETAPFNRSGTPPLTGRRAASYRPARFPPTSFCGTVRNGALPACEAAGLVDRRAGVCMVAGLAQRAQWIFGQVQGLMFAVIRTGGKQYRVAEGETIRVERLAGEAGDGLVFEDVLMLGGDGAAKVGAPTVAGASVSATLVEQARGAKIIVFKKRRRQNSRRRNGHRQHYSLVRIDSIADGTEASGESDGA